MGRSKNIDNIKLERVQITLDSRIVNKLKRLRKITGIKISTLVEEALIEELPKMERKVKYFIVR